jgi:CRP-like cAMP-binding protein
MQDRNRNRMMADIPVTRWLHSDAFAELPSAAILLLEQCTRERSFSRGEHLIRQGKIGEEMFFVTSGQVAVVTEDLDGHQHIIAHTGPGEILGEMALLAREPRTAHAIAEESVVARVLAVADFHTLVARHPEFSQFLTQLVATRVGGSDRDVLVGRNMEGYRIVRRLGRGGMAVVYEAVDEHDRQVALKMMSHRLVFDEGSRDLFQQEADIIASFDHPHIVRMLGRFSMFYTYFIVVEFIDGLSLHDLLQRKRGLPHAMVRRILGQLVQALGYAHDSGIIHRDIKPGNVMITREGRVKLMDFGLAKPVGARTAGNRLLVGTPGYMAPEQFEQASLQPATDVFSLGCLAVELLTGKKLFDQSSINKLLEAVTAWPGWDPSSLPVQLDSDLADVLAGWLSPDPADRFARFEEVADWAGPVDASAVIKPLEAEDPDVTRIEDPGLDSTIEN